MGLSQYIYVYVHANGHRITRCDAALTDSPCISDSGKGCGGRLPESLRQGICRRQGGRRGAAPPVESCAPDARARCHGRTESSPGGRAIGHLSRGSTVNVLLVNVLPVNVVNRGRQPDRETDRES